MFTGGVKGAATSSQQASEEEKPVKGRAGLGRSKSLPVSLSLPALSSPSNSLPQPRSGKIHTDSNKNHNSMADLNFLRIPLMMLSDMTSTDVDEFKGLPADNLARFSEEYGSQEQADIRKSLKFVLSQEKFDFQPYLPPDSGFSNIQARAFLTKVAMSIAE
jgi:hypothetical protein